MTKDEILDLMISALPTLDDIYPNQKYVADREDYESDPLPSQASVRRKDQDESVDEMPDYQEEYRQMKFQEELAELKRKYPIHDFSRVNEYTNLGIEECWAWIDQDYFDYG